MVAITWQENFFGEDFQNRRKIMTRNAPYSPKRNPVQVNTSS